MGQPGSPRQLALGREVGSRGSGCGCRGALGHGVAGRHIGRGSPVATTRAMALETALAEAADLTGTDPPSELPNAQPWHMASTPAMSRMSVS